MDIGVAKDIGMLVVGIGGAVWARYQHRETKDTKKIVTGNGHGNISQMQEATLESLSRLEGKIDGALRWQGDHEGEHIRLAQHGHG